MLEFLLLNEWECNTNSYFFSYNRHKIITIKTDMYKLSLATNIKKQICMFISTWKITKKSKSYDDRMFAI